METVDHEAVPLSEMHGELVELGEGKVGGPAADLTDEMVMFGVLAEVHDGGAVSEVNMVEAAGNLESLDAPVDRGDVDTPTRLPLGEAVELGHGEMLVVVTSENPAHGSPGHRHPHPRPPEVVDENLGTQLRHGVTVMIRRAPGSA